MAAQAELLKRLRKEEANRKGGKPEVALAATMKKGGEAKLLNAAPPKGHKSGTPFHLPNGAEILCKSKDKYKVEASITGHVFVVRSAATQKLYAMKIEWLSEEKNPAKQMLREVHLLTDAARAEPRFSRHFPRLQNKGRLPKMFNWLLINLADYDLNDLRKVVLKGCDFSKADAARLCMQTFQAVHDLHSLGYLHRDLSPAKFVLGLDNPHVVYLIGYSRSLHFQRKFDIKPRGSPRKLPKMANRSFLPRNYHKHKDLFRKDDLESWSVPDTPMLVNKERLFCDGYEAVWEHVPKQVLTIMTNLDKHADDKRPDYTFIGLTLCDMKNKVDFPMTGPFEWQGGKAGGGKDKDGVEVLDAADDKAKPGNSKAKKRGGFKDDNESDSDKSSKKQHGSSYRTARSARSAGGVAKSPAARFDSLKEQRKNEEILRQSPNARAQAMQAAIANEAKQTEELKQKLAQMKSGPGGVSVEGAEKMKEMIKQRMAEVKERQDQVRLKQLQVEKETMLVKIDQAQAKQKVLAYEKERKEIEELAAQLRELEEQKQKDEAELKQMEIKKEREIAEKKARESAGRISPAPVPERSQAYTTQDGKKINNSVYF